MKKTIVTCLTIALMVSLSSFTAFLVADYQPISEKAQVKYTGVDGPGSFTGLKATIKFDENDLANASISASIDVNSLNTGMGMKNKHALAEENLNGAKFPTIEFVSNAVTKTESGYMAKGNLTMKGVTKPMEIAFTFTPATEGGVFKGTFSVFKGEFGIAKSPKDETKITLEVPVTRI